MDRASYPLKPVLAAALWMIFNVFLAGWWMYFSLGIVHDFKYERMLKMEGVILIISLILGGAALLYFILLERKEHRKTTEFFAAFTHDLKTTLASLRIQAEALEELDPQANSNPVFRRLVRDTVRLEHQLENALILAQGDANQFLQEAVFVSRVLDILRANWPDVVIEYVGEAPAHLALNGDRRAIESIFKNLIHNAVLHGKAKRITIRGELLQNGRIMILVCDEGVGFKGKIEELGELFHRHSSSSGSGVGLFLVRTLAEKMNGQVTFSSTLDGFCAGVELPGGMK